MFESLTFITGNMNKVHMTQKYLPIKVTHQKLDLTEIQSLDPKEVIVHKLREAFKEIQKPVLVEDTSLVFHGLGKLPGPFVRWFLEEIGTEDMCRLVDNKDRSATATVTYGVYDGKTLLTFTGVEPGSIAQHPAGTNGFGWDPIFIPQGQTKTHGEMTHDELANFSCRIKAIAKIKEYLKKQ